MSMRTAASINLLDSPGDYNSISHDNAIGDGYDNSSDHKILTRLPLQILPRSLPLLAS